VRTPEVMRLTLNAAETGHLVLATMHSATCAEALTRLCMSFPAEIQGNIRAQLAGGEDGMWTFDRYGRWMEPMKDWVRAAPDVMEAPAALRDEMDLEELANLATQIERRSR
jgi:twitching motility protein PilT